MSFVKPKAIIEAGDTVVVYTGPEEIQYIVVDPNEALQNKYGRFPHKDLIGKPYGSKIPAVKGRGFIYVLYPTPELWTTVLKHRTQILYAADIALVVHMLGLCPGKVVCESGTGSASLTHALARAVAPSGHVHTFDFHQHRVDVASKELLEHGFGDVVTVKQADALNDGFGLDDVADAVFLDLPAPHKALDTVCRAFKRSGGRFCSFSPCIEQVQATCLELEKRGFIDIQTWETLERQSSCTQASLLNPFFGYSKKDVADARSKCEKLFGSLDDDADDDASPKPSASGGGATTDPTSRDDDIQQKAPAKRKRWFIDGTPEEEALINKARGRPPRQTNVDYDTARWDGSQRGHTGYLTFAVWPHQEL